jgi:hypothetical protein
MQKVVSLAVPAVAFSVVAAMILGDYFQYQRQRLKPCPQIGAHSTTSAVAGGSVSSFAAMPAAWSMGLVMALPV